MCGRFVISSKLESLRKHFPIDAEAVEIAPNYNVAPTQEIPAIARHDDQNHLEKFYWGLVPFWAKDKTIGSRMINARYETVATKPAFRAALGNADAWSRQWFLRMETDQRAETADVPDIAGRQSICICRTVGNLG